MMSESARRLAGDPAHVDFARMLAARAARRYRFDHEELVGPALLGLCHAAARYESGRGHDFLAFAAPRIAGAMADFARRWRDGGRGQPGVRTAAATDLIPSDDLPVGSLEESRDAVEALIRDLPASRRAAVRLLYLDCSVAHVQSRAAGRMGVGRTRVQQLHAEALDMLRRRFAPRPAAGRSCHDAANRAHPGEARRGT